MFSSLVNLLPNTRRHHSHFHSHFPQPSWPADFRGLQRCLVRCQSAGVWNWALIQHVWILLQCSLNDCSQVLLQINMPSVVFEEVYRVPSLDL